MAESQPSKLLVAGSIPVARSRKERGLSGGTPKAILDAIRAGRIVPALVRQRVEPYSIETQMARLFAHHRALQDSAPPSGRRGFSVKEAASRG